MMSHQTSLATIPTTTRRGPYLLGRDATESQRLADQHEVLLKAAGGYIPVPLAVRPEAMEAVLDLGTGNAQWLLGLRRSGLISSATELCGVDVSDKMMPSPELGKSLGLNLEVRDLCEPLPAIWNNKFDYIHGRHVLIWIEPYKWPSIIYNLKKALKPGGTLVIIYPGSTPYDKKSNLPLAKQTAPSKLFRAFLKFTESSGLPRQEVKNLPEILKQTGFDSKTIRTKKNKINLGLAESDVKLRPASTHHLDLILELIAKQQFSQQLGCPSPEDHEGWSKLYEDWRIAADEGFYYNLHIISAQKNKNK